jgi:prevent-host-death family protein
MQVNILEAKNSLSYLIKSAIEGEDVIIANRGEPVVRLVPINVGAMSPALREKVALTSVIPPSQAGGIGQWLDANPLPAYAQRNALEIDADIEAARNAWD